jgi:epoxyqueuosine reductase
MDSALNIVEKAKELGYDTCGILPVSQMSGYAEKLEERIQRFPETKEKYSRFRAFATPQKTYPWAKAVIICSYWYGKYRIPQNLQGRFAKYYLTDGRTNKVSDGYITSIAFEHYLKEQGFQIAFDRHFGITALRWAAMKAGLGIVRKNNFLYTEKGSWQYLEAFLIDQPLEHINECTVRPCSHGCSLCMTACPTNSLSEPYMMCRNTCVSCMTTWSGWDLRNDPLQSKFGRWVYGCDSCQDCCPFNHNAWTGEDEYPGLQDLSEHLSLIQLVTADYDYLRHVVQPALWYIPADKCWKYKTNALNAMLNNYRPEYFTAIQSACADPEEPVREMAKWVLTQVDIGSL